MKPPKFLIGDNTKTPDSIFIIHTESPAFVIDVDTEEIFYLEEGFAQGDEESTANEITELVNEAFAFYDKEIQAYESLED